MAAKPHAPRTEEDRREGDPTRPGALRRRLQAVAGHTTGSAVSHMDDLVHQRVRLGIVSALAVADWLTFTELREVLHTTDGNLSVHARKLEEAGYVECRKGFSDRMPRTEFRLTARGRKSLERYLDHMTALIVAMRGGEE